MYENETTQQKMAKILGISRQSVAQYLDSSAQPSIDKLYKLAEYFECSTDYLLGSSPYRNYQEWSELHEATNDDEDGENVSPFGMLIYRRFKEFVDAIDSINNELDFDTMNKFQISDTLYENVCGIISAYKTAVENMDDVCSHRTNIDGLIKCLIDDIRKADNSGAFIVLLLEHTRNALGSGRRM